VEVELWAMFVHYWVADRETVMRQLGLAPDGSGPERGHCGRESASGRLQHRILCSGQKQVYAIVQNNGRYCGQPRRSIRV
ncbi:MAG: hypothetical protein ACWGQW_16935, partial [bacterium]